MTLSLQECSQSVREAIRVATRGLVDREKLAELILLAAVAQEHMLVIGPPGTAKSQVVRQVAKAMGGNYFEYLLGRFTEPGEIFGPVDLRQLREGVIRTETKEMLPEAHIAFLDEVFLGSTAILNTLLGILNERQFKRGHTVLDCPLRVCVGAANAVPEDESLAAFADRFLLQIFLEPLSDALLEEMLDGGWTASQKVLEQVSNLEHIDFLSEAARKADLTQVRPHIAHAVRLIRKAGIRLSDRRIVKAQILIAAAGVLAGRENPTNADLWPLVFAVPSPEGQSLARETLHEILKHSENATLTTAAESSSQGVLARAQRLLQHGQELLANEPEGRPEEWLLKVEALGREIEAGVPESAMPEPLKALRASLASLLETGYAAR